MSRLNERTNPNVTKTLEQDIIEHRRAVKEAHEVLTLKEHAGWDRLRANIVNQLDGLENELDTFEKLNERQLVLALKERKDFRWIVNVLDKVEAGLPMLEQNLDNLEKKLADRKAAAASGTR